MEEKRFKRKDGSDGTDYKLEAGDKVVSNYASPLRVENGGYIFWKLGVTAEGYDEEITLSLSDGQAKKLNNAGDIKGKTIEAYEYDNPVKVGEKAIGVAVKD